MERTGCQYKRGDVSGAPHLGPATPPPASQAAGCCRMRGTALALLALLVAAGEGRGEGNTVKLCGRDFVRAVVFTCGGSRWKRHLTDYPYLFGKYQLTLTG